MKNMKNMKKIFTLCRGKGCCPELFEDNNGNYILVDDYRGSVKLTKDELIILNEKLNEMCKDVK